MMVDILDRLIQWDDPDWSHLPRGFLIDIRDAGIAIKNHRTEIADLWEVDTAWCSLLQESIRLRSETDAENIKLRAALTELLAMCERQVDFNDDRDGLTLKRARAALGGEG